MSARSNVLQRKPRPTRKSYRSAVKKIVLDLQAQHDLNDPELAERLGCSAGTISNARREVSNLDGVTLANIEFEFGPSAIDPFMALGGSRAVPLVAGEAADRSASLALVGALQVIIESEAETSPGGHRTLPEEVAPHLAKLRAARTALDGLIALAGSLAVVA